MSDTTELDPRAVLDWVLLYMNHRQALEEVLVDLAQEWCKEKGNNLEDYIDTIELFSEPDNKIWFNGWVAGRCGYAEYITIPYEWLLAKLAARLVEKPNDPNLTIETSTTTYELPKNVRLALTPDSTGNPPPLSFSQTNEEPT